MKRNTSILFLASLVIASVALAPIAIAGPVGSVELNLSYAKSSSELGTSNEPMGGGIGFGAAYWRGVSPSVSWGGEVSFDNLGNFENNGYDALVGNWAENFETKVFRINPSIRMNLGTAVGPSFYAQGGMGLYKISWKYDYQDEAANVIVGDDSYSKIGFNLGAGVGFPVGPKTRMNISTSYHVVPVDENVKTVADNLNNLQLRAGIGFNL